MRQPPAKKTTKPLDIDPDFAAMTTVAPSIDPDFASISLAEAPKPAKQSLLGKAKETIADVMSAGLGILPGAASMYGALTPVFQPGKTIQQGAEEFLEANKAAKERSPTATNPFMPQNVAMAALPYALPLGQGTMLSRALYSAGVGAVRGGEQAALEQQPIADVAKKAAIGSAVEVGSGLLFGEPLGAIARSMRTPTRAAQAKMLRSKTRQAETPLYTQFENQGPLAIDPAVMQEPIIRRVLKMVKQDPELRKLPDTHPVVLDRIFKNLGEKAFAGKKYTPTKEAFKNAKSLLTGEMDAASQTIPYSEVTSVASAGRRIEGSNKLGAEAARFASAGSPGTYETTVRLSKNAIRSAAEKASLAERQAMAEGAFGFLKDAPKSARLGFGRIGVPTFVIPSRATYQAPLVSEAAGIGPTLLQRNVRGGAGTVPSIAGNELYRFFTGES